jgi:2-polyprenyl-3-methyl-5-hydroxy-6-metoxy-1,4-benzoquinol methylase
MASIQDDRGYNQGFKPSKAMDIRMDRRCDYMIRQMDLSKKNTSILEIGCGTGEISYFLSQKTDTDVLGTDICLPFIKECKKRYSSPNLKYEVLDFTSAKSIKKVVGNKKFDYIVGNGIIHHMFYKLDKALVDINKLLATDGKMIFLEPNILNPYCFLIFKSSYFRKFAKLEPDEMAFSKQLIIKKLETARYKNIKIEHRDFLLPVTPSFLIKSAIAIGSVVEKIPLLNKLSQSIYISASKS